MTREELIHEIISYLSEKNFEPVAQNLKLLASAADTEPEAVGDVLRILDIMPQAVGGPKATDLAINLLREAPEGSALQEKVAGKLISLSFLEDISLIRAAETAWQAAKSLLPAGYAGQAAIDRILDLADKPVENESEFPPAQRLVYIRAAASQAVAGSDLVEKAAGLWFKYSSVLQPEQQLPDIKTLAWKLPDDSPFREKVSALWADTVRKMFEEKGVNYVLPEITSVIANPLTAGDLERKANRLWLEALGHCHRQSFERMLLVASATSGKLYETSPRPEDFAAIKEIVAQTLLDLADNTVDIPHYYYDAVMEAAEYAGNNAALHSRIEEALVDIIHDDERYHPEQIAAAARALLSHASCNPSRPPQPPAPPAPW